LFGCQKILSFLNQKVIADPIKYETKTKIMVLSSNYFCGDGRRASTSASSSGRTRDTTSTGSASNNLWLTVLFTVTVFLGLCVDDSFGFFTSSAFTTKTTNKNNLVVGARATYSATTTTKTTITSLSLLFSTTRKQRLSLLSSTTGADVVVAVTDAPTKPKTVEEEKIKILKDNDTESQEKNGKDGWEIRLFNDPMNHRTFVAKCLCEICGKSDGESYQIMMQAHKNGMGVVGRYHYEIAELYYGSLKEEGLTVEMVQVDDE